MPTDPECAALAALDEMESLAGLAGYSQRYEDLLYEHASALFSLARRAKRVEEEIAACHNVIRAHDLVGEVESERARLARAAIAASEGGGRDRPEDRGDDGDWNENVRLCGKTD